MIAAALSPHRLYSLNTDLIIPGTYKILVYQIRHSHVICSIGLFNLVSISVIMCHWNTASVRELVAHSNAYNFFIS